MVSLFEIGRAAARGALIFAGLGTLAVFISPFDLVEAVLNEPLQMALRLLVTACIGALSGAGLSAVLGTTSEEKVINAPEQSDQ